MGNFREKEIVWDAAFVFLRGHGMHLCFYGGKKRSRETHLGRPSNISPGEKR